MSAKDLSRNPHTPKQQGQEKWMGSRHTQKNYNLNMTFKVIDGGSRGIRVVFTDKTFVDFPKMNGQAFVSGDKYSGELLIGDWDKNNKWFSVATFQKESYSYAMQIPTT
jgi:hypothetical protein